MDYAKDFSTTITEIKEWLSKEFSQVSTGRINPAMFDSIQIDSYGTMQPIKAVASMTVEDPRTLRIAPWDKSVIKPIESAIIDSKLPVSVAVDDAGLRVSVPQMTAETKAEIAKMVKAKLEEARVRVRKERESVHKLIDGADHSDDEQHGFRDEIQKLVDGANADLQSMFASKEADITSV